MKRTLTITILVLMTLAQAYAGSSEIARDQQDRDPNSAVGAVVPINPGLCGRADAETVNGVLYLLPAADIWTTRDKLSPTPVSGGKGENEAPGACQCGGAILGVCATTAVWGS